MKRFIVMCEYSATTYSSTFEKGVNKNTLFMQKETGIQMGIGVYTKSEFSPEMVDAYGYLDLSV